MICDENISQSKNNTNTEIDESKPSEINEDKMDTPEENLGEPANQIAD